LELKKDIGLSGQVKFGGNLTPEAKDHTKNWDGSTIQADFNYGVELGQNGGFLNATLSFQHRQPTSRAGVRSGEIYNAYNAIEGRAAANGVDLNSNYTNINLLSGSQESDFISLIQQYAEDVDYFNTDFQNRIQSATSIADLQALLGKDV